jgi:hypothetical protein
MTGYLRLQAFEGGPDAERLAAVHERPKVISARPG